MTLKMRTVLLLCSCLVGFQGTQADGGLEGKMLIFPAPSKDSCVTLSPEKIKALTAFTVCMRAFTDLERSACLFSFATPSSPNDILIFRTGRGKYTFAVASQELYYKAEVPVASSEHICASWESNTGIASFMVNGRRLASKGLKRGYSINSESIIILGQDQDTFGGGFDDNQSFVGELEDVHMWDHVLSPEEMWEAWSRVSSIQGNFLNWKTMKYSLTGYIVINPANPPFNKYS